MQKHGTIGAILIAAAALAGCATTPLTNETTPPTLALNIGDASNGTPTIYGAPEAVIPANPKKMAVDDGVNVDPALNSNYVYNLAIEAKDAGGIASFGYSESFISFGGCNPNSDYGQGSTYDFPNTPVPLNGDGTAQGEQIGIVVVSAKTERSLECGATPGSDLAGAYIITATATNYSKLTATATWFINVGTQHGLPAEPTDGK